MSKALFDLLCGLYPRPADLRRFLEHGEQGAAIALNLPDEVGLARVADEGIKELMRRGLVQDALERAGAEFPQRLADVLAAAKTCGVTLTVPFTSTTPPPAGVATAARQVPEPPAAPTAPLRWLHISDIHVGSRGEAAWWHVLDHLTGDLTYQGARAEYDRLTKFLQRLLTHLPRGPGQPRPAAPGGT